MKMMYNIVYTQQDFLEKHELFEKKLAERRSNLQTYIYDRIVKELYPDDVKKSIRLIAHINMHNYLKQLEKDLHDFSQFLKYDFIIYSNDISIEYHVDKAINAVIEEKTKEYDDEFLWCILKTLGTRFNFERQFSFEELRTWLDEEN